MSYARPNGGYGNASFRTATQQQSSNRYEDAYSAGLNGGDARRARRAGGYGGSSLQPDGARLQSDGPGLQSEGSRSQSDGYYNTRESYSTQDPFNAPPVPEWRRGERIDQQQVNERRPTEYERSQASYGPGARGMEGVVQHIQEKWSVLVRDDCVPVHIALQLMDYSSLGRGNDYEDFKKTSQALQRSLRTIVNENHQGFNSSIGTFHKIQDSIQTSQERVRTLKIALDETRLNLTMSKPELKGISFASQNFDQMLQNIAQIERIQTLPEQLDAAISDKHFLTAVDILQHGSQLISNSELENVGALTDLRNYLSNQETSLTDILLEELHDHLYLKSPYCQSRWKPYTPQSIDPQADLSNMATGVRPLYRFLTGLNVLTPMVNDTTRNPEQDNFEYIHMIIEALNKMGRLDMAVDRIDQRLPLELFAVMEKTNQEVDARHPAHLRSLPGKLSYTAKLGVTPGTEAILNDLLYTLYSKFEAIAEGHRVVQEVIEGIIARENLKRTASLTRGFKELWKLLQSEMRSLLHDYLATDGSGAMYNAKDSVNAGSNIFQKNPRDRQKQVFKLNELDLKSTQLVAEQEELDKILQKSVPGLVEKSQRRSITNTSDRRVTYETRTQGHKVLVDPNPFHINLLLPPSLSFLQRLKDIVPPDSDIAVSTLTSFLDDFLVNVFNPQLDDTITELCSQVFNDPGAYHPDPQWSNYSRTPIFKGTAQFLILIKSFCWIVNSIPQDQVLSQLVVSQLESYYRQCNAWYTSMVTRPEDTDGKARLKRAAAKMEDSELAGVTTSLWECEDETERVRLLQEEVNLIINLTDANPFDPLDMISDRRTGTAICLLYGTLQWLSDELTQLRVIERKTDQDRNHNSANKPGQKLNRWTMVSTANLRDDDQPVRLTLTEETIKYHYVLSINPH